MNFIQMVAGFSIFTGAVVMAINIFKFRALLSILNQFFIKEYGKIKILFNLHYTLMIFFILGYVVVLCAIIMEIELIGDLFVGIIFLFGAIFVLLGILLQSRMLASIGVSYSQALTSRAILEREQGKLMETNEQLKLEMDERKWKEEMLKESEDRYRGLVENSTDFIYTLDLKGNFTDVNKAAEHLTGYTKAELTKMNFRDYTSRDAYEEISRAFHRVFQEGKSLKDYPLKVVVKDGTEKYFETSAGPIKKGNEIIGFQCSSRDITERLKAEEALRESKEKYRSIFDKAAEGIVVIQGDIVKFINGRMLEIIGYSPKELKQIANQSFLGFIHPEDQEFVANRYSKRLKGEKLPSTYSIRFTKKNGQVVWTDISPNVIIWEGKQSLLVFVTDITERKRLEGKLRQAEKMEVIGTLAGGVAHDLNNVLAGLISYPELLLMDMPEYNPYRNYISKIQNSGEKAAAIVQDLLTLARRGVAVTEVVNLDIILNEYLMSPEYEKLELYHPKVEVETNLEPKLLNILGSPVHLSKTVMNLVSNAAEAMPDGGTISISTENRYIDKPIKGYDNVEEGDYVVLKVQDNGMGIPSKDLDKIFEPFYTKKVMGRSGTGLGMAVVWGTVKDHKGYIDVQSREGKGTIFTLYFPVSRKETTEVRSGLSIEDYVGKGESILIVDDVKEQRDIACIVLSELGYSVSAVSSGEKAVEYMQNNSTDLLVLDMIMDPGIDGLDTYSHILELHPEQKAIIVSGFSETDRVKEAQRLGAGQYIKKPYTLEKIGLAVKEELMK